MLREMHCSCEMRQCQTTPMREFVADRANPVQTSRSSACQSRQVRCNYSTTFPAHWIRTRSAFLSSQPVRLNPMRKASQGRLRLAVARLLREILYEPMIHTQTVIVRISGGIDFFWLDMRWNGIDISGKHEVFWLRTLPGMERELDEIPECRIRKRANIELRQNRSQKARPLLSTRRSNDEKTQVVLPAAGSTKAR